MKTIISVYFILMLPVVMQAHKMMKQTINEQMRTNPLYNLNVFIKLIIYTPRWWWLFFVNIFNKFKKK
jgi:hypothetical protein